jgi:hypothetical protein
VNTTEHNDTRDKHPVTSAAESPDGEVVASGVRAGEPPAPSQDLRNAAGPDSTLDTDGKTTDAFLDRTPNFDNIMRSNASSSEAVATDPLGLAGYDSRPYGNSPAIAEADAYTVEQAGTALELPPWHAVAVPGRDPVASAESPFTYGTRVVKVLKITPKAKP